MLKNKVLTSVVAGGITLVGLAAGIATMASAQTSTTTVTPTATSATLQATDTPEPGDVADSATGATHGHAPLGGDGVVSSINGTTIVMGEESDEGGATYTVDASKATVTNSGAAGTLADVKVGEKIFVQGAVSGTNVTATSISVGHPGGHMESANDTDGSAASEASEPAGSGTSTDQ